MGSRVYGLFACSQANLVWTANLLKHWWTTPGSKTWWIGKKWYCDVSEWIIICGAVQHRFLIRVAVVVRRSQNEVSFRGYPPLAEPDWGDWNRHHLCCRSHSCCTMHDNAQTHSFSAIYLHRKNTVCENSLSKRLPLFALLTAHQVNLLQDTELAISHLEWPITLCRWIIQVDTTGTYSGIFLGTFSFIIAVCWHTAQNDKLKLDIFNIYFTTQLWHPFVQ